MTLNLSDFKVIRGARIVEQMQLVESTYDDLYGDIERGFPRTTKRQHATDPIRIVGIGYVEYVPSKRLMVNGKARSNGKVYNPTIVFSNIVYEDEDTNDNVTFMANNSRKYHIQPIDLRESNIRVRCNCLDFFYRFAHHNLKDRSLWGSNPKQYVRKTKTRPPVNPLKVPGVCKHLIKLADALVDSGLVAR